MDYFNAIYPLGVAVAALFLLQSEINRWGCFTRHAPFKIGKI